MVRQEPAKFPFPSSNLGATFMLYLVSTPIGNLDDISIRAISILSSCDYILAEDTRNSLKLLNHLKIKKKLIPFHKFNEKKMEDRIIEDLKNGKNICLISDSGTPVICDPGHSLIKRAIEEKILYTAIPGACSLINALVLSGEDPLPFQFIGFLPKKSADQLLNYPGLSVFFESAKRISKTLQSLDKLDPKRVVIIVREMTKIFEEVLKGTAKELLDHFSKKPAKGEMVVIISKKENLYEDLSVDKLLQMFMESGLCKNEALKKVAKLKKLKKRDLYKNDIDRNRS